MTTVRLLAELKRRQQMSVTLLQQLDEQFDLKERAMDLRQIGREKLRDAAYMGAALKQEVLRTLRDTRFTDVASSLEDKAGTLSPAVQKRLGISSESIADPSFVINRGVDKGLQMVRSLSAHLDSPNRLRASLRDWETATPECREHVEDALRQVYASLDVEGSGFVTAIELRRGLAAGDDSLLLEPARAYKLLGAMDTEMQGYLSWESFREYALRHCAGRMMEVHALSEGMDGQQLIAHRQHLVDEAVRMIAASAYESGERMRVKAKSSALKALEASKGFVKQRLFHDSDEEDEEALERRKSLRLTPAAAGQKIVSKYQEVKGHLKKLEATQSILDDRIASIKERAKDLVFDEVQQTVVDMKLAFEQQAEANGDPPPFWKSMASSKYGGFLNLLLSGKLPKADRKTATQAIFAIIELEITFYWSGLLLMRMPVVLLCFIALATSWSTLTGCGGDFGWVRYFILVACLLETVVLVCRFVYWWRVYKYHVMEAKMDRELKLQEKAARERLEAERERKRQEEEERQLRKSESKKAKKAKKQKPESPQQTQRSLFRTLSETVTGGSPPTDRESGSSDRSSKGSGGGEAGPTAMTLGTAAKVQLARGKFKKPIRKKITEVVKTQIKVGDQIIAPKAQKQVRLGREAVRILGSLTHSPLAILLRVASWLSFGWGAYGSAHILRAGSPLFDEAVCEPLGFFTVALKIWLTVYFVFMLVCFIHLCINCFYLSARHCGCCDRLSRRVAKRWDDESGLPLPLYTLLLEQWVLLPKSTPAALAKLQRQKEKDEEAFLERKRKR